MAEAFARMHGAGKVEAFSAGSRPSGRVNPKAVEAMKELGYDLTTHASKGLDEFNGQEFDVAVTMGCGDECPLVRAKPRVDWQIPDPRDMTPGAVPRSARPHRSEGEGTACDVVATDHFATREPEFAFDAPYFFPAAIYVARLAQRSTHNRQLANRSLFL